jgi:hypothetical protein
MDSDNGKTTTQPDATNDVSSPVSIASPPDYASAEVAIAAVGDIVTKVVEKPEEKPEEEKKDAINPFDDQFLKLFKIIDVIYDGIDRKLNKALQSYRLFSIIYNAKLIGCCIDSVKELRNKILIKWDNTMSFHSLLLAEKVFVTPVSEMKLKASQNLFIHDIYSFAVERALGAAGKLSKAPEIFRLHFARILNMAESDKRLIAEIEKLEKSLHLKDGTPKQTVNVASQMKNLFDLSNVPPQFQGMAKIIQPHLGAVEQLGNKFITPEIMEKLSKGDLKGMKSIAKQVGKQVLSDKETRKNLTQFSGMVSPMMKTAQSMFKAGGIDLPEMLSGDDITLENVLEKAEKEMDEDDEEVSKKQAEAGPSDVEKSEPTSDETVVD